MKPFWATQTNFVRACTVKSDYLKNPTDISTTRKEVKAMPKCSINHVSISTRWTWEMLAKYIFHLKPFILNLHKCVLVLKFIHISYSWKQVRHAFSWCEYKGLCRTWNFIHISDSWKQVLHAFAWRDYKGVYKIWKFIHISTSWKQVWLAFA